MIELSQPRRGRMSDLYRLIVFTEFLPDDELIDLIEVSKRATKENLIVKVDGLIRAHSARVMVSGEYYHALHCGNARTWGDQREMSGNDLQTQSPARCCLMPKPIPMVREDLTVDEIKRVLELTEQAKSWESIVKTGADLGRTSTSPDLVPKHEMVLSAWDRFSGMKDYHEIVHADDPRSYLK